MPTQPTVLVKYLEVNSLKRRNIEETIDYLQKLPANLKKGKFIYASDGEGEGDVDVYIRYEEEETAEDIAKRLKVEEASKDMRYKRYLELKAEFEPEPAPEPKE